MKTSGNFVRSLIPVLVHSHCQRTRPKPRQVQIPITSTHNPIGICAVICHTILYMYKPFSICVGVGHRKHTINGAFTLPDSDSDKVSNVDKIRDCLHLAFFRPFLSAAPLIFLRHV